MPNKKSLSAGAKTCIAVILMAGILCSAAAGAADWKQYAGDQYFSYYYDAKTVKYPYKTIFNVLKLEMAKINIASVWTKRIIKDVRGREWQVQEQKKQGFTTKGYDRYEYTLARKELNCQEKKYRLVSEADYSKDGDLLGSFEKEAQFMDWKSILPESDTEALHRAICENQNENPPEQHGLQVGGE